MRSCNSFASYVRASNENPSHRPCGWRKASTLASGARTLVIAKAGGVEDLFEELSWVPAEGLGSGHELFISVDCPSHVPDVLVYLTVKGEPTKRTAAHFLAGGQLSASRRSLRQLGIPSEGRR